MNNFKEFLTNGIINESNTPSDEEVVNGYFNDKVLANLTDKKDAAENLIELYKKIKEFDYMDKAGLEDEGYGSLVVFDKITLSKDFSSAKVTATAYVNTSDYDIDVDSSKVNVTIQA